MNGKDIILALHFEFKGDFDKIYDFISNKKDATEILEKWQSKIDKHRDDYLWFYDEGYPEELKHSVRPPFIVLRKNLKTYKFRFRIDTDIEVIADNFVKAKAMAAESFLNEGPDFEVVRVIHRRK